MQKKQVARHRGNYARANSLRADYDKYTLYAGIILGIFFGLLIGWGF